LSRQNVNALDNDAHFDSAAIQSEESLTYTVESTEKPVNCFRSRKVIEQADFTSVKSIPLFKSKTRHIVRFTDRTTLLRSLKDLVKIDVVNAIHCELPILAFIQHDLIVAFPSTSLVIDITNSTEQREIMTTEYNRAHEQDRKM